MTDWSKFQPISDDKNSVDWDLFTPVESAKAAPETFQTTDPMGSDLASAIASAGAAAPGEGPGIIDRITNALPSPMRAVVRGMQGVVNSDTFKSIAAPAVSATTAIPQGAERAVRGAARRAMNSENTLSDFNPTMGYSPTETPEEIYGKETDKEKAQRAVGVERALASVPSIPGAAALADYGENVKKQIENSRSPEAKKAIKESQITGNILKGEIDFGTNPTAQGLWYQAVGVLGSMAPVVFTAIVTKSPIAAGLSGGASAANEGARAAEEAISALNDEQLAQASPFFRQMIEGGADPKEARDLTSRRGAESAAILQGIVATFGDKFTAKLMTDGLGKTALKVAGKSAAARVGVGSVLSATEQGVQEVGEGVAADLGLANVLPDTEIGKDSAGNLVLGALGGLGPGALGGSRRQEEEPAIPTAEQMMRERGFLTPERQPLNFTPAESPSAQAGLAPIVVPDATPVAPAEEQAPLPTVNPETERSFGLDQLRMGATNVSATGGVDSATGVGSVAGSDQSGGSVGAAGLDVTGTTGPVDGTAQAAAPDVGATATAGVGAGQRVANLTQDYNNGVVQPVEQWFGRKGDGYVTQADASQALPGRQRMFPELGWKVEQMPNGKFRLAGYSQETTRGATPAQAVETETQGQEAPAAGTAGITAGDAQSGMALPQQRNADLAQAGAPAPALSESDVQLKLAPPAPIKAFNSVRASLQKNDKVDIAMVPASGWSDTHKLGAAVARMLGKTYTVYEYNDGDRNAVPNAFVERLAGNHIMVDTNTDDAPVFVAFHEGFHALPDSIRKKAEAALIAQFKSENMEGFKRTFQLEGVSQEVLDAEIPAYMAQAIVRRPDFINELREKLGNRDFAEFAKVLLGKLKEILTKARDVYGDDFVKTYIRDIDSARAILTDAYAQAMREQGMQADVDVAGDVQPMASRRGAEQVGEFEVRTMKDGTAIVYGDPQAIRAQIPEDVKGRVTKDGIVFTTAAAPRVKAALSGRTTAYSREGAVLDKLPMKNGKYVGAPEKFNTPAKIPTLRKWLRQLADEGAPGRYWYENSGREVLKMVGGDVQEARKFVALLAIYSPQAKVDANSTFALRAWAQYKNGQPISVKTGSQDRKATEAMQDVDAFWKGEKTGNFFFNLLREIDPSTAGKQGATIDMWMMRAGQYDNDAPTSTQYAFMENETNRLAAELGWEPQQVQAAIWVAMKARMENSGVKKRTEASSEKKGWIRYDYPLKNDRPTKTRVILDAKAHRDNWLKQSFAHDPTKDDTAQAKFDFGDGLKRHIGQVSFEARPGRSTGVLPGIHAAPYAQQVEFQQAVQAAFLDEDGNDRLAQLLGLMVDSNDVLVPGVWQGEISPSSQKLVAMAPSKGVEGKTQVDPAQADALNIYAAIAGLVARQEGVGWHRPFYSATKRDSNGLDINIGRAINPAEAKDLEAAVGKWMADNGYEGWQEKFAFISSPTGIRLVNFGIITNEKLHSEILGVAEAVLPSGEAQWFASSGDMMTNDWKESPNGQDYVERARAAGRSDVLDWARAVLAPRVQRVFNDFSDRYGWGDPGVSPVFSRRAAGSSEPARGPGARPDARDGSSVTGIHFGKTAGLSRLTGASFGSGIKGAEQARLNEPGVDPRIKKRVYFYLANNNADMPRPEAGLGSHVYRAELGNMYDPSKASDEAVARVRAAMQGAGANAFESAVLDAGFRGYVNREQGTAVVLNADVPVAYEGLAQAGQMRDRKVERIQSGPTTRVEGDELVRRPTSEEMLGVIRARPALAEAAPSFRLQYGDARVLASEAAAADAALADAGASFQFGGVMRSNKAQTETPQFKRWFGDSKVVDANGKPLVVYHGTMADFSEFDTQGVEGAAFFSVNPEVAGQFGITAYESAGEEGVNAPNTMPVYLSIKNPLVLEAKDVMEEYNNRLIHKFDRMIAAVKRAKAAGYDGLHIRNVPEFDGMPAADQFAVFRPEQIKSATGNNGEFDPANPDIRRSNRARDSWFIGRDEAGRPTFGAGAKAYRLAADLANVVLDKVAMKPISKDLSRAMRKMKVEIEQARKLTAGVATKLSELSPDERELISDVIEKELKRGVKPPKRVLEVAASMRDIMSEQTAELVRLGMLTEDAAGRWDGKYLPRFYESKLMDEGKQWLRAAKSLLGRTKTMQGIKGSSLKGRGLFQTVPVEELEQWLAEGWEERDPNFNPDTDTEITLWRDYTREERENMGEIRDAMFRFVMGYTKSQKDIALGRLYENLANTVASKKEKEGYVQVPRTNVEDTVARRYGKLAGMWVPKEVLDHLSAFDDSQQNALMKFYSKAMSMWKEGKTVLNPVSHANNVLSNVTMAHFAGVSYWDIHKYIAATRDLVKKDARVQEAIDAGLFGGTMTQAELVNMLPDQLKVLAAKTESKAGKAVGTVWDAMSFWLRKPLGKAYEAEDLYFRYLIYRDARERGLSPDDAVDYAQKYIFTYDDLPKGARAVRNFALPFFAYTYKVVPTLAETALQTPWRYAAPASILFAANAIAYAIAAGGDDDDWMELIKRYVTDEEFRKKAKAMEADERANLPEWMKGASLSLGTQKTIRLGVDEVTGLPVFLDVSRIFPGGDLFDAHNNAGGVPLLAPITPNNPVLTVASAMLFNKDTFRGTDLVKPSDTKEEAAAKRAKWMYQQVAPAIAVGNSHFDRAMNVIANVTGQPLNLGVTEYTGVDNQGLPVQPGYAAMQTVGIKARPVDLEAGAEIQKSQQKALIREIEADMRRTRRLEQRGALSSEQAEKMREQQVEKRQRLREGLTVDGNEKE